MTPAAFTMPDRTVDRLPPDLADELMRFKTAATRRPGREPPEYVLTFLDVPGRIFLRVLDALRAAE